MKKSLLLAAALFSASLTQAQGFFEPVSYAGAMGTTNWAQGWVEWNPNAKAYPGDPGQPGNVVQVTGDITTNTTWTAGNVYELRGLVKVKNNAVLTIEPGTIIRGYKTTSNTEKGTLLVSRGAKLVAVGTATNPIVFTSGQQAGFDGTGTPYRQRGDWGGILICGRAHVNTPSGTKAYEALATEPDAEYGGGLAFDDNDNSGELRYVRIEYAGYAYVTNQELNSLTLAGVGRGTQINYVQCSYGNDDSFEWFGGTVDHKHLIAFAGTDDDFDMDEGYNGRVQFGVIVRHPQVFEYGTGTSNGFEHDNNTNYGGSGVPVVPGNPNPTPITAPLISNVTLVGPIRANEGPSALSSAAAPRFGRALEFRSNASTQLHNSIITGFPSLLRFNNGANTVTPSTQTKAIADSLTIRNSFFSAFRWVGGASRLVSTSNTPTGVTFGASEARAWLAAANRSNDTSYADANQLGITAPFYTGNPTGDFNNVNFNGLDFTLQANSPALNKASFAEARIAAQVVSLRPTLGGVHTRVYPNPTSNQLTIAYLAGSNEQVTANLYDLNGRVVKTVLAGSYSGNVVIDADVAGVTPGVYMLHISTATASETHRLVIK